MPTSTGRAAPAGHARRRAAAAYSASASSEQAAHRRAAPQELFEDDRGGRGIEIAGAASAAASVVRVALVDLVHRQPEAAVQLAREAPGALGYCRAPRRRGGSGTPTTSASGCHSRISAPMAAKRASPSAAHGASAAAPAASGCCRWPRRPAAGRNRRPERTAGGSRDARLAAHACPASWLSMRGSTPSSASAALVALLDRGVEDDRRVGVHGEPAVAADLVLELAGATSRCSPA